ncbi:hypothetical protein N7528_004778 [Penicillium herquei]|nr:hypothetical protein N7528_004778 [Penicillium herquei]
MAGDFGGHSLPAPSPESKDSDSSASAWLGSAVGLASFGLGIYNAYTQRRDKLEKKKEEEILREKKALEDESQRAIKAQKQEMKARDEEIKAREEETQRELRVLERDFHREIRDLELEAQREVVERLGRTHATDMQRQLFVENEMYRLLVDLDARFTRFTRSVSSGH